MTTVARLEEASDLADDQMMDVHSRSLKGYKVVDTPDGRYAVVGRASGRTWKVLDDEDEAYRWRENMEAARRYARS